MPSPPPFLLSALLALLAFSLATPSARAQAGGNAAPKTATLGGGGGSSGGGPLLTRDELRGCLKQQGEIGVRRPPLETQHQRMQDEKAAIVQEMQALKGEREKIDRARSAVVEINARQTALGGRIEQWNARFKALEAGELKLNAAEREVMEREREAIKRDGEKLEADRAAFAGQEEMVRAFNARAAVQDRKVDDWNARNGKLAAELRALQGEREQWAAACADRRYREDDEIAIRRGQ